MSRNCDPVSRISSVILVPHIITSYLSNYHIITRLLLYDYGVDEYTHELVKYSVNHTSIGARSSQLPGPNYQMIRPRGKPMARSPRRAATRKAGPVENPRGHLLAARGGNEKSGTRA